MAKKISMRWISYKKKKDAARELRSFKKRHPHEAFGIKSLKGGEALDKYRKQKGAKYVKTKKRYQVVEYV